jgi:hypothetical protein
MKYPIISSDRRIQAHYVKARRAGTSHNLAEMFALRLPPMSNSDREFLEGHVNGNQFANNPQIGNLYRRRARAAGVNPTGKVYLSGLAEYPGDPRAWISGRGDAARLCEERGWEADGAVKVRAARQVEHPEVEVADDILDDEADKILAAHPEPRKVDRGELKHQIKEKRKPPWKKRKKKG